MVCGEERGIRKRPVLAEMGESDAEEGENQLCRARLQMALPRFEERKSVRGKSALEKSERGESVGEVNE
jgi:hypothetical protein